MSEHNGKHVLIIVMGTSGCGKSTFGSLLAQSLSIPFLDGDDFHPQGNVKKMSRGEALTDEDRWPWLQAIREKAIQVTHPIHGQLSSDREKSSKDHPSIEEERIREMAEIHETSRQHDQDHSLSDERPSNPTGPPVVSSTSSAKIEKACVIACSALKRSYRNFLRGDASSDLLVIHIYMQVDAEELHRRMRERKGHFMKESMLQSQLATLEDPSGEPNTIVIEGEAPDQQVQKARQQLMKFFSS